MKNVLKQKKKVIFKIVFISRSVKLQLFTLMIKSQLLL